ncbi:Uncharacterised protein [Legionella pneumophila]|uniref:hypothetical protein n=1 Tax=Legionella pneumophila TaxID=446 RepID=UPI0000444C6C|nr:hypothetical protein [Legionella pneumophila]ERH42141.1 hypothetical protein N751_02420 [Legionella pneumophila str. Leg01/11]ERH44636.1 hypothetical protein N750_08390 [Legionella pneumophila str. Leg01/53]ERI47393.1 hypothetical protein N749_14160 [Legionella pneumophila str. Leg01/20]AEW51299.1 hypothetical protein lp12_1031 [Legionella pneumophila subsp. pneumophila ATCC 43290]ANN95163.1 hypothetical protein A9P84_05380 [Legionella pneumophila]
MKKYLDVKWLSLLVLNVLLITFVCVKNQLPANHNELNILGEQLTSIQTQLKQPVEQPDLSPITQNLNQLNNFVQQLKNKDEHQLGEIFTTEQGAIKKQLEGITDLLRHLDETKKPVKILSASQLPFKVLSIDSIQEIPTVSLAYHYKTQALEKGDTLAGWTVFEIDFAKQIIEFENADKAHVLVHLNQHEVSHA